eukprot:8928590-Heterocapsa_arctica.AAC.1
MSAPPPAGTLCGRGARRSGGHQSAGLRCRPRGLRAFRAQTFGLDLLGQMPCGLPPHPCVPLER